MPPAMLERLERAYRDGVSIEDLSERFGLSHTVVRRHLSDREIARAVAPRNLSWLEALVLDCWRRGQNTMQMRDAIIERSHVIVTEADCYNALARVHNLYTETQRKEHIAPAQDAADGLHA